MPARNDGVQFCFVEAVDGIAELTGDDGLAIVPERFDVIPGQRAQGGFDPFFELNPNRNSGWGIGVQVDVPIFNGFQTSRTIADAAVTRDRAEEDLREGVHLLDQQVRSGVIDLDNAYTALQVELRALDLSRRQLSLAREQYQLGAIDFQRLQTVIDGASNAERQAVTAEYNFSVALVNLEERIGRSVGL